MLTSHPIAVLQAESLVGSRFPKPILIHRVLTRQRPHFYDVVALARHGGFEATQRAVEVKDGQSLSEALLPFWREHLGGRPVIVDLTTGDLFVTRVIGDTVQAFVEIGNLYDAFGGRPPEGVEAGYATTFLGHDEAGTMEALLSGKPDMPREEAAHAARTRTPVLMTGSEILKTLIAAIARQATRYQRGEIDIQPGRRNEIHGYSLA